VRAGSGEWWQHLKNAAAQRLSHGATHGAHWYYFGAALLGVESEDPEFSSRFRDIYSECAVQRPLDGVLPRVSLRVVVLPSAPDWLSISVAPTIPGGAVFLRQLFPERGYQECPAAEPEWLLLAQAVEKNTRKKKI